MSGDFTDAVNDGYHYVNLSATANGRKNIDGHALFDTELHTVQHDSDGGVIGTLFITIAEDERQMHATAMLNARANDVERFLTAMTGKRVVVTFMPTFRYIENVKRAAAGVEVYTSKLDKLTEV